mgnify:FL=1
MKTCVKLILLLFSFAAYAATVTLTAAEYGAKWPFTVDRVTLSCRNVAAVLLEAPDGKTYTLNGKAQGQFPNLPDSRVIQKPHPQFKGAVMALPDDIISRGLALCPK